MQYNNTIAIHNHFGSSFGSRVSHVEGLVASQACASTYQAWGLETAAAATAFRGSCWGLRRPLQGALWWRPFCFLNHFFDSFSKFIVVELPWKTGLCASSHKTWWSSTTCCTLSPDFPSRRLWTGLCFLSLSFSLSKKKTNTGCGW